MGNCQATDAAAAVIQHQDGRVQRLYWPTSAEEVMRSHPGYYVALVTFSISGDGANAASTGGAPVRLTRVRLLKHKEMLLIGQVYRLITSQEVTKALRARKLIKKQRQREKQISVVEEGVDVGEGDAQISSEKMNQAAKQDNERQRSSRHWRPSLQSISEMGS